MRTPYASVLADLLFVLVGSAQAWLAWRLPNGIGLSAAEPGPGLFPAIVGALMAVSAAAHLSLNRRTVTAASPAQEGSAMAIVWLVLSLAAYILLLPRAGFVPASVGLTLCTLSIYGMPGWGRRLGTALAITGVAYLVFTRGLGVNMPAASWFN